MNWERIAKDKQEKRLKLLPQLWLAKQPLSSIKDIERNLSSHEIEITRSSGVELVTKLKSGALKVRTVVEAFCHRATLAQQLTNCLTEIFFEEALQRADSLDAAKSKDGLLFGLPVSIKDSVHVKGYDSTIGYIYFVNKPATVNGVYYESLVDQGAVVIAKTNIPQTLMCAESVNNVWGRCLNPYNTDYGAGGSSGGEGALVACRGVVIGTGTDVGGSTRIPCHCNGVMGIRPSAGRLPMAGGQRPSRLGASEIMAAIGPMANDIHDVELAFKAVNETKPWLADNSLISLAWRDITHSTFKVGFFKQWGNIVPHPPVLRALEEVIEKVKHAGIEVVELTDMPTDQTTVQRNQQARKILSGIDSFKASLSLIEAGNEPAVTLVKKAGYLSSPSYTLEEVIQARADRIEFSDKVMTSFNRNLPGDFDVILCPPAPHSSLMHDTWTYTWYTNVWNYLDLPAVVLPITCVDPLIDLDRKLQSDDAFAAHIESLYDPKAMKGLPVGVQVIGRRLRDEELLKSVITIAELLS